MKWRTCANCGETPVAGCLCHRCVRASLVPLLIAALIDWVIKKF
jgi:hypothetical protein